METEEEDRSESALSGVVCGARPRRRVRREGGGEGGGIVRLGGLGSVKVVSEVSEQERWKAVAELARLVGVGIAELRIPIQINSHTTHPARTGNRPTSSNPRQPTQHHPPYLITPPHQPTTHTTLTMAPISDVFLTNLANTLGAAAVLLIVVFQFVEISAKRENEALVARGVPQPATVE